jgi:hypothetical protein
VSDEVYEVAIEDVWPLAGRLIVVGTHTGEPIQSDDRAVILDGSREVASIDAFASLDDHPPGKVAILIGKFGLAGVAVGQRLVGQRR